VSSSVEALRTENMTADERGNGEMKTKMKRVLFIAFDFPPRRTSGVYRPTALTKYLPRLGWQPTVLTVRGVRGQVEDLTLMERIPPEVLVARTRYMAVDGWEKLFGRSSRSAPATSGGVKTQPRPGRESRSLVKWLLRSLRAALYFPDRTAGWIPFGLVEAVKLHRKNRFDLIATTSPPRSGPVIGWLLKLLLGIPWVAEFRDPWLPPSDVREMLGEPVPRWRRSLDRLLYTSMLGRADAVVTVTQGHADELQNQYRVKRDKLFVVMNGFDEEDFGDSNGTNGDLFPPTHLHLSHFGTIYPHFSGKFFPALIELLKECPEFRDRLHINIVGFPDDEVLQYSRREELQGIIQIHRFIEHKDAIRAMRSSHCLLLFYAHPYISKSYIPGKIYEYLRVGRPILAVAYDGGAKQLIQEGKAGWVLEPDDIGGIKKALKTLLNQSLASGSRTPADPEYVAKFRYDHVAQNLARVFGEVVGDGR